MPHLHTPLCSTLAAGSCGTLHIDEVAVGPLIGRLDSAGH